MTKFNETDDGRAFIESGASRETDRRIMEAIASLAKNVAEAEALWNGDFVAAQLDGIWDAATRNGYVDANDLLWGDQSLAEIMVDYE